MIISDSLSVVVIVKAPVEEMVMVEPVVVAVKPDAVNAVAKFVAAVAVVAPTRTLV
jgi:hypothetical protein